MAQEESKNLQKYFENDPPSFFDDLAPKEGKFSLKIAWKLKFENLNFSEESRSQKVSSEVRDLWPYPGKGDKYTPTVPLVTVESLVWWTYFDLITKFQSELS